MTTDDKIKGEKLQFDINREPAEISALFQVKLINIDILQVRSYYHPIKVE